MKIISSEFVKSAMRPEDYPRDRRPEIAFVGRSNVGKSSLMNTLLRRKGLAKTSNTPGKTQTINFFDINEKIYFVDLPGYGYAKVSKVLRDNWNQVMMDFLEQREPLRLVVMLVDARHKPSDNDLHMLELLDEAQVPVLIAATKIDKLKQSQRKKNIDTIRRTLDLDDDAYVLPFSSVSKEGVKELWQVLDEVLG